MKLIRSTIGSMIEKIRKKQRISQGSLCSGLCSIQTISKIEGDLCETDTLLLDMLLQRLGKSPDKLEIILPLEEYQRIRCRDLIETVIWKGKKNKAEALLNHYQSLFIKLNSAQTMFLFRSKARIAYQLEHDLLSAQTFIQKALEQTLSGWMASTLSDYLISTLEMENLLLLSRLMLEQGNLSDAFSLLDHCVIYIKEHITDAEEYAKIFSKASWLQARILYLRGDYSLSLSIIEEAISNLRQCGIIFFMLPLLQLMCDCYTKMGIVHNLWFDWFHNLKALYDKYADRWYCQDDLLHNCYQREYHLDCELIRWERKAQGYSQFDLIENVYQSPETLSRIETGKTSPNKHNFEELMKKLNLDKRRYNSAVVVDSYEVLELNQQLDRVLNRKQYEEAEKVFEILKNSLNLTIMQNLQLVKMTENILLYRKGDRNLEHYLQEALTALSYTYQFKPKRIYRYPMLNESVIFCQIGEAYEHNGNMQKTTSLYELLIHSFYKSKIDIKYHYRSLGLLLANRLILHTNKNMDDIEKLFVQSIHYELTCEKGDLLAVTLLSGALYNRNIVREEEKFKNLIYYSIHMGQIFYQNQYLSLIKKYFSEFIPNDF